MATSAGKRADVYVTAGAPVAMPLEAMSDISASVPGAAVRTVYAVTNNIKRYFDRSAALAFDISLNSGVNWNPVVPDVVDAGFIRFNASQQAAPAAMFRVNSGNYLPYSRMGGGHEWEITPVLDLAESTEFMQNSKTRTATLISGSVTLDRYWLDDTMRSRFGALLVIILYIDASTQPTGPRYELLARMKADALKAAVQGLVEEQISFEYETEPSFRSS